MEEVLRIYLREALREGVFIRYPCASHLVAKLSTGSSCPQHDSDDDAADVETSELARRLLLERRFMSRLRVLESICLLTIQEVLARQVVKEEWKHPMRELGVLWVQGWEAAARAAQQRMCSEQWYVLRHADVRMRELCCRYECPFWTLVAARKGGEAACTPHTRNKAIIP